MRKVWWQHSVGQVLGGHRAGSCSLLLWLLPVTSGLWVVQDMRDTCHLGKAETGNDGGNTRSVHGGEAWSWACISSVQLLSRVWLFVAPWAAARQASLSITKFQSLSKLMSIESVMPSNHLIPCCPLLLLPSIFPSIRVFSNESALHIRWPKYWSFSFNISPFNEHPGLISFRMDWLDLPAVQGTLKSLLQHHSSKTSILLRSAFFIVQLSHPYRRRHWRLLPGRSHGRRSLVGCSLCGR